MQEAHWGKREPKVVNSKKIKLWTRRRGYKLIGSPQTKYQGKFLLANLLEIEASQQTKEQKTTDFPSPTGVKAWAPSLWSRFWKEIFAGKASFGTEIWWLWVGRGFSRVLEVEEVVRVLCSTAREVFPDSVLSNFLFFVFFSFLQSFFFRKSGSFVQIWASEVLVDKRIVSILSTLNFHWTWSQEFLMELDLERE